jgi:hypothetical protein
MAFFIVPIVGTSNLTIKPVNEGISGDRMTEDFTTSVYFMYIVTTWWGAPTLSCGHRGPFLRE